MNKALLKKKRKEKFRRQMKTILIVLLVFTILSAAALLWNLYRINNTDTGSGNTLAAENAGSEYSNAYYTIGNNPTKIDKKYFKELNKAVKDNDQATIATALVKCFVSEYYTWTNKDGTYDIGGIQYIYTDRQSDFESYTRNEVYADMDLYISQMGRDKLMQVKEVTADDAVSAGQVTLKTSAAKVQETAGPYSTADPSAADSAAADEATYDAYTVHAEWTYDENTDMNLSNAQKSADFTVVNHDGRMEIAAIN